MKSLPAPFFFKAMKEEVRDMFDDPAFKYFSHAKGENPAGWYCWEREYPEEGAIYCKAPYSPGERCYVGETYAELLAVSPATDEPLEITKGERLIEPPTSWVDDKGRTHWYYDGLVIAYREDSNIEFCDADGGMGDFADKTDFPRWKSPVTMPAKYARRFVIILSCEPVRIEEVTEEDCSRLDLNGGCLTCGEMQPCGCGYPVPDYRDSFLYDWHRKHPGKEWAWRVEGKEGEDGKG